MNVDNSKEFRCISFCTGYGGVELGLRAVIPNLRTVAYVEVEAFACSNLVAKIEAGKLDAAPIWTDIKTFNGRPFRDRIHLITGGYPCQPFSVAGKRQGESDPRHLWPYIEQQIRTIRPLFCFFENVGGHLTIGFSDVYRSLRNLGYSVEAGLFTAAECGAPHKRERLYILAYAGHSTRCPEFGQQQKECTEKLCGSNKLADTNRNGQFNKQRAGRKLPNSQLRKSCLWPSRPGQPQYEWEEPRVVADTRCDESGGRAGLRQAEKIAGRTPGENKEGGCRGKGKAGIGTERESGDESEQAENGQTQSRLGGATDGSAYPLDIAKGIRGGYLVKPGGEIGHNLVLEAKQRTDRLRLLGNGVVPECAAKAFEYLSREL